LFFSFTICLQIESLIEVHDCAGRKFFQEEEKNMKKIDYIFFLREEKEMKNTHFQVRKIIPFSDQG